MSKPVGSTEQHGPHLPVMVDYRLATEVARRGAVKLAAAGHPVLVTPTVWTGFAEHHIELGGTITLDYAVFHGVIRGVVRSLRATASAASASSTAMAATSRRSSSRSAS
jgi:creatinine amidohydrolase